MANIPTPRSFVQILGDMVDTVLSNVGLKKLKAGNPVLSILEAAAQSDLRSSQDTFDVLNAQSLDRATGIALERIGADDRLTKIPESPASGSVTVLDTSFVKKATKIYQGRPAPVVGSDVIYVNDASSFPSSGQIYIGRGTSNYEGPLTYISTNPVPSVSPLYWELQLSGGNTQKFHNLSESVVLAQGGNRTVSAGALVQTPQGNASDAIQFSVIYNVTVPDGETELTGVLVTAQKPGVVGNVAAKSITSFVTAPFTGASVTNPLPFTNGQAAEQDEAFRERIRDVRQSRSRGTALAIKTGVIGVTATDENKRISSAQVVTRQGYPTTLYIDDGTGYEERSTGVAIESLVDRAISGEEFFQLASPKPVTKAFVTSTVSSPYTLQAGSKLAVRVGGITHEHTFNADEFRSIQNATAFEVVASINGNSDIPFSARTSESGTKFTVFAKVESNEDIEVVVPGGDDIDANQWFGFAAGRVDTLRLYRNDRLLMKDGKRAVITSAPNSAWGTLTSPQTLEIAVDGIAISGPDESDVYQPYLTFTDQDFVDANTGFNTLSSANSLEAWAAVFNAKIPGVTCTASLGSLSLVSNADADGRASIVIGATNSTLVSNGVFTSLLGLEAYGADNDYQLDRNTGQIRLETPLNLSDKLSAGTTATAAFLESSAVVGLQTLSTDGELWFAVDGDAQIVTHGLNASTTVTYSIAATESWGKRVRLTTTGASFRNVQVGDWVVFWDPSLASQDLGAFRIADVATDGTFVEVERDSTYTSPGGITFPSTGISFARTKAALQKVVFASGSYAAQNFANELNAQLVGASATLYRGNRIRVATDTLDDNGDIALVAMNSEAGKSGFSLSSATQNLDSHLPTVEAFGSDVGTPEFVMDAATVESADGTSLTVVNTEVLGVTPAHRIVGVRNLPDASSERYGNHTGMNFVVESVTSPTITLRTGPSAGWLEEDRVYAASLLAISPEDDLISVVDGDVLSKRFSVPMFRKLRPTDTTYGLLNYFEDSDNNAESLSQAFGYDFPFEDFALYMRARAKSGVGGDTNRALWSYYRWGPEGNNVRLNYTYPQVSSAPVEVLTNILGSEYTDVSIVLPSDAPRTLALRASTRIGCAIDTTSPLKLFKYILGFDISSATRLTNVVTLTLDLTGPDVTDHGLQIGDKVYVNSTGINFPTGLKTITARTTTTVTYAETGANATEPNIGTVSFDTTAEASFVSASLAVGDIITIASTGTAIDAEYTGLSLRINEVGDQYVVATYNSDNGAANEGVVSWGALQNTSAISIYPINAGQATITAIVSAVNALAAEDDSIVPITGQALTGHTSTVLEATYEDAPSNPWFYFADGVNYVKVVTSPADPDTTTDYRFEFKNAITADLATDSFWSGEEVRLAPITTQNVVDYLSSSAVGGLFASASLAAAENATKLQITSNTPGSLGSIQVQGGSANSFSAAVVGSGSIVDAYSVATFRKTDIQGLMGGMWVRLQNTVAMPKSAFESGTYMNNVTSDGRFILHNSSTTRAWTKTADTNTDVEWQVEKHGKFVAYVWTGNGPAAFAGAFSLEEGDWAMIERTQTDGALSSVNAGNFRVVRVDFAAKTFWIENPNAVEEIGVASRIRFRSFDSAMPGDKLIISGTMWGAANVGEWTIVDSGLDGSSDNLTFLVDTTDGNTTVASVGATLGVNLNLVQLIEAEPSSLIKKVKSVSPNQTNGAFSDVKFTTYNGTPIVSSVAGTLLAPLDKLNFPTSLATGIDGYNYSTGLIGEATRVIYGDQRDTATYPGIVAAGANVNVSGPLVKRIVVALAIRVRSGVSTVDIIDRVKSVVASVVNKVGIGQAVAISDIVSAAVTVNGVVAVTVLSPVYGQGTDLIAVQPYEKALVLNLDQDVLVSLVGE